MLNVTRITTDDKEELADVDVSKLTRQEAHDLRFQLRQELLDSPDLMSEDAKKLYHRKIKELVAFLGTD